MFYLTTHSAHFRIMSERPYHGATSRSLVRTRRCKFHYVALPLGPVRKPFDYSKGVGRRIEGTIGDFILNSQTLSDFVVKTSTILNN